MYKLPLRSAVLLGTALCLTACISDEAHRLYVDGLAPKSPDDVKILYDNPSRSYRVIADLQARNATSDYMRKEAAKIGADAVLISYVGGMRDPDDKWADEATSESYVRIAGTAIVFED